MKCFWIYFLLKAPWSDANWPTDFDKMLFKIDFLWTYTFSLLLSLSQMDEKSERDNVLLS